MASLQSASEHSILLPSLNGSTLKVIALVSMVTDHCAYYLMEHGTLLYEVMRCFGRIAFPVFAFLITEGFRHTRNRMKYFLQLLGFAVVSELPWYLLNGADGTHNVLFTLTLGVMALAAIKALKKDGIPCGAVILSIAGFATWSGVDYEWRGILMMVVFYLLGNVSKPSFPSGRKAQLFCAFPLMMHYGIVGTLLASLVIACYDGTRGFIHGKVAKYGFYAFYPAHLIAIDITLYLNVFLNSLICLNS